MINITALEIVTTRLNLIPLSYEQLILLRDRPEELRREFNVSIAQRSSSREVSYTLNHNIIPAAMAAPENLLFITRWLIIYREDNEIVGDIGFKGAPAENEVIEISYETYPDYRGKGIMTEAVGGMTFWAFKQPGVQYVIANTTKNNLASIKVLVRSGFLPMEAYASAYWWKLDKDSSISQ